MNAASIIHLETPIASIGSVPHAIIDGNSIWATMDVPTPPERVFRALTTDEVERWWGSNDTYRITQWAADLRLGGRWSLVVQTPDGNVHPAGGIFVKISPPHVLVQTRKYQWNHPTLGWVDTIVTYQLDSIDGGTRVTVRHDGFAGRSDAAAEHVVGWERFLGWLCSYMFNELQIQSGSRDEAD